MSSVQQIVERQVAKAQMAGIHRTPRVQGEPPAPVITISREPLAKGELVGRAVADALGYTYWDHELLARVAQESGALETVLAQRDERIQSPVSDYLESLLVGIEYSQDEYRRMLVRVVNEVARLGSAVLVGRASHLILGGDQALRVRVVCPKRTRVARLRAQEHLSAAEARHRIRSTERQLRAFVRHHFKHRISAAQDFDLIVNTGAYTVPQAAEIILAAYRVRFPTEAIETS